MSSKFLKVIFAVAMSIGMFGQANAGLIVGENYLDSNNLTWEYVGSYDMIDGPSWPSDSPAPYNGLEAAIASGVTNLPLADIAIAAFDVDFDFDLVSTGDQLVNHMAWYDGAGVAISMFSEDILADGNGDGFYTQGVFSNGQTDRSAWVNDRVFFAGDYVNHVFKRVSVSEPATLAIFALAMISLVSVRRRKN